MSDNNNTVSDPKDIVAGLNRDAMSKVKDETKLPFRASEWALWRPTRRTRGMLRGVVEGVTCLATDGVLGAFVFDNAASHPTLGTAFFGHVAHFEWDEERKLKVPIKDEVTGEERTVTITQRKGAPPTLHSASSIDGKGKNERTARIASPKRKLSKAVENALLLLDL